MNIAFFLVVVAWVLAPILTAWSSLIIYLAMTYEGSTQQLCDRLEGMKRTYTVGYAPIVAIVLWAYIITYYFG
jgi:phosphate/sulfate permease